MRFFGLVCCFAVSVCALAANAGYRPLPHPLRLTNALPSAVTSGRVRLKASPLPAKYDLRNEDGAGTSYLSPIRNQNPYGTCWAHAPMVGIEYLLRKDEGIDADLSENNLANLHGFGATYDQGGNDFMAAAVFLREEGPVTEVTDPYPGVGKSVRERGVRIPRKIVFIPGRSSSTSASDLTVIKEAVRKYGPITTSYYHSGTYSKGGAYYCPNQITPNHAVAIVGWDDDYASSNFKTTPPGNGAFIIKNSWGTGYFDNGYNYISYYDATMGFDSMFAYLNLSKGEDYGHLYQHDPYGLVQNTGYGINTVYGLNVFTARANEELAAFGFYALEQNAQYEATVYVQPVMQGLGELSYASKTTVASGTLTDAGYEVLTFSQPVSVGAGTNFAISVKITLPSSGKPLPVMVNDYFPDGTPYLDRVVAEEGKSYVCADPTQYYWEDISLNECYFCCKVYSKPAAPDRTTSSEPAVPHGWLDAYSTGRGDACLDTFFYGAYNALAEHVASNGMSVATSYAKGLDPDNATETNLVADITFDATGRPVIGIAPKNDALWSYTTLGSTDLLNWHVQTEGDCFFKVRIEPRQ